MVLPQRNFGYQTYVDDDSVSWNKRGEIGGAAAAVDGHAAAVATQPVWHNERQNHVRRVVYQDSTTGRKAIPIIYTAAAYAAIAKGDIISVPVPGSATNVNYACVDKLPERKRGSPSFSTHLADHA